MMTQQNNKSKETQDSFCKMILKHNNNREKRVQQSKHTVKNAVELFFAFHPDVEKIQYH